MTPAELDACFDRFRESAFRLETLPAYAVGGAEAERIAAFSEGRPRPERSVRTSPWLARMAVTTAAGKRWQRVRILDEPLTEYQCYQLASYTESAACGEEIRIAVRNSRPALAAMPQDFWLFDAGTPGAFAVLLDYDSAGRFTGAQMQDGAEAVLEYRAVADWAARYSVPLNEFLATARVRTAA